MIIQSKPADSSRRSGKRTSLRTTGRTGDVASDLGEVVTTATPPGKTGTRVAPMLGPAFVAAIAYVDPGNVATNLTAGATLRYTLVWVVVAASLVAILVQFQAAKLGMATGESLPQLCRRRFSRLGGRMLWLQAEVVVLATDLAEFVGAAIGMQLLFGMPVAASAVSTAVVSLALLELRRKGRTRPFELMGAAALMLVGSGIGYNIFLRETSPRAGSPPG